MAGSNTGYQQGTTSAPQKARAVLSSIGSQVHVAAVLAQATFTTALAGANNDLTYTALNAGTTGNAITVTYVVAGNSTPLSVSVTGTAITVNVATSGGGAATSTAAQVRDAVNGSAQAAALVHVDNAAGNDGTGVVTALSAQSLAAGVSLTTGQQGSAKLPTQAPIHFRYA